MTDRSFTVKGLAVMSDQVASLLCVLPPHHRLERFAAQDELREHAREEVNREHRFARGCPCQVKMTCTSS